MTNYYCRVGFSDSNNGLTPATAVGTLNKLFGTTALMVSGDVAYIGGGIYRLTAAQAITLAPSAETKIIGDPTGEFTGDAGEVIITGYGTNDTTAPFTGTLFSFAVARNFYTWENVTFQAGTGIIFPWAATGCNNWVFNDCVFYGRLAGSDIFTLTTTGGAASNITWRRCYAKIQGGAAFMSITSTLHVTTDYDLNINAYGCYFHYKSGRPFNMNTVTGTGVGIPYGCNAYGCHFDGNANAFILTTAAHSAAGGAAKSIWKYNQFDCGANAAINAGSTNQVTADYNRSLGIVAYTNTTAGANDDATTARSWRPDMHQLAKYGFPMRHWMTPGPSDPHNIMVGSGEAYPATDLLNRPVPAGGASINFPVGALARHDTAVVGSQLGGDVGGYSELVGPSDEDRRLWVNAISTTVTVKVKWDTNHGDTNKPQLLLLANGAIGVTAQTITATGTINSAYETLTVTFTPTVAGEVRLRLRNRAAAGTGILAFDTWTVT